MQDQTQGFKIGLTQKPIRTEVKRMKSYVLASALIIGLIALGVGFTDFTVSVPVKKSPALFKEAVNLHQKNYAAANSEEIIIKYDQALRAAGREGDTQIEAAGFFNLGAVYCDTHRYRQAAECYQRAMALFKEARNAEGEWLTIAGLRLTYANRNSRAKSPNVSQMKTSTDTDGGQTQNKPMIY
jgi:tetratricopeptide (TPR) repeat protein